MWRSAANSPVRALVTVAAIVFAGLGVGSWAASPPAHAAPVVFDVTADPYNAAGNGTTNDRQAIQSAIDDASDAGGGVVLLPAGGEFLSGSLTLRNNVTLEIDGTLLQSQVDDHYAFQPIRGRHLDSGIRGDLTMFHNQPFIYGGHVSDVGVTGNGTIQITQVTSDADTIELAAIGFYEVSYFEVSNLSILGATQYNVQLISSDHGIVKNMHMVAASGRSGGYAPNSDGVGATNSRHLRITGNSITNGDDGIKVTSLYDDPRAYQSSLGGIEWWSADYPQAPIDIEIDHNTIVTPRAGVTFIAWGYGADPRDTEISNIRIHDNALTSSTNAIGCWCDPSYLGHESKQSPIRNVRIYNNEYDAPGMQPFTATDLKTDYGAMGSPAILNGSFDQPGSVWWSQSGDAGSSGKYGDAGPTNGDAAAAADVLDPEGAVGYVEVSDQGGESVLYEGLGLSEDIPGVPFGTGMYKLSAKIVTGDQPAQLFAYNTCTGETIKTKEVVTSGAIQDVEMDFRISGSCDDVHTGVKVRGDSGNAWAVFDDVAVDRDITVIDDTDDAISYDGVWRAYDGVADWGGTHTTALSSHASATVTFTGARAVLKGILSGSGGIANVYVDDEFMGTVDFYSAVRRAQATIFDTGQLDMGQHTLRIERTETRDPESSNVYAVIDVIFVDSHPLVAPAFTADTPPPNATVGTDYTYTFAATGNPSPTFSVSDGAPPDGLTLDAASGVISGKPTTAGVATFTVAASNGVSPDAMSGLITITVAPAPVAPEFTAQSPPQDATVGVAYSYMFAASGVPEPSFAVSEGTLPPGLSLDGVTGSLSGIPRDAGSWTFAVAASNGSDPVAVSDPITIVVAFADYPPGSVFFDDVQWLAQSGITRGFADGLFHPTRVVSRQTMAAMLYRLSNDGQTAPACTTEVFSDVPVDSVFCGAISWLVGAGITQGFPDGLFHPTRVVSRQTMAAMLYRVSNDGQTAPACTTEVFSDVPVDSVFCGAISWLAAHNVTEGYPDGGFHPAATVTRQTMAAFLHRLPATG